MKLSRGRALIKRRALQHGVQLAGLHNGHGDVLIEHNALQSGAQLARLHKARPWGRACPA